MNHDCKSPDCLKAEYCTRPQPFDLREFPIPSPTIAEQSAEIEARAAELRDTHPRIVEPMAFWVRHAIAEIYGDVEPTF